MTVSGSLASGSTTRNSAGAVAVWLLACCAMVFVMVVLGGVTRLTHAGLSIVEWQPLMGLIPPLSEPAWLDVFTKYQAYPEYQQLNHAMTLAEFKAIFWLEYFHRLWGRLIGAVFLVPFLYFLAKGQIERQLRPHLALLFVLGGLQGLLGWYMVKSGLVDRPDVSQYRLAAHLAVAFAIYGYMFWLALGLIYGGAGHMTDKRAPAAAGRGALLCALVFATAMIGAFVAGLDAGFAFNTFPLMNGSLIPEDFLALSPWYRNFFENVPAVQFAHRWLAIATFALIVLFWAGARTMTLPSPTRIFLHGLLLTAALQVALGIATLLLVVPVPLAALHQAGALALFTAALACTHRLRAAAGLVNFPSAPGFRSSSN
ncbi:MAG: COX15/CtaA family protein [Alphaproteobacteria bacterium]